MCIMLLYLASIPSTFVLNRVACGLSLLLVWVHFCDVYHIVFAVVLIFRFSFGSLNAICLWAVLPLKASGNIKGSCMFSASQYLGL